MEPLITGTDAEHSTDDRCVTLLTPEELAMVREWATVGMHPAAIAQSLSVTEERLIEFCGDEVANASLTSHLAVLDTLYQMATSQRHTAATIFWVKTQCAHLFASPESKGDSPKAESCSRKSPKPDVSDPNDLTRRITFTVYNNDGEPNADY